MPPECARTGWFAWPLANDIQRNLLEPLAEALAAAGMAVSVMALHNQLGGLRIDPLRMFEAAAGFIGIVGAGLIVFSRGKVHNLTTAAHLWLATVIGLACGLGQWPLVAVLAIISLVMITIMRFVEGWFGHNDRTLDGD